MKKCQFCAELIQDDAVKCRFCNEFIKSEKPLPWYFSKFFITLVLMVFYPIALPLIVLHPTMSKIKKAGFVIVILLITFYFMHIFSMMQNLVENYGQLGF